MGGTRLRARAAVIAFVAVVVPYVAAPVPARAAVVDVTLTVDAATPAPPIDPRLGGTVMILRDVDEPLEVVSDLNLTSGRVDSWDYNSPPNLMPQCWSGTPSDFALLDPYIEWTLAAGVDPRQSEFRVLYTSSCHVTGSADGATDGLVRAGATGYAPAWIGAVFTDPEAVEQMLTELIGHVAARYGFRRFVVWAEPDGGHATAPQAYNEYYELANRALRLVEAELGHDLEIGGPAVAGTPASDLYLRLFFDHVVENGLDLDAVVVHKYVASDGNPTSAFVTQYLNRVKRDMATLRERAPHLDPELVVDEWGYDASANNPSNVDGSAAAFVTSNLTAFAEVGVDAADYFFLHDNPDAPESCDEGGAGCQGLDNYVRYGLLDSDGRPRSSYHALRFFAALGPHRIAAAPAYQQVAGRQEWGAVAARSSNGLVRVLLRNWDPERSGDDLRVALDVTGLDVAGWDSEEVGIATDGAVVRRSGEGVPTIDLPANHTVLLTLRPSDVAESIPPDTVIASGPPPRHRSSTAEMRFASSEPAARFECRLDAQVYAPCARRLKLGGLAPGPHSFRVRAVDAAGNADPSPAVLTWWVTDGDTGWVGPAADSPDGADGFADAAAAHDDDGEVAAGSTGSRHIFRGFATDVPDGAVVKGLEVRVDWMPDTPVGAPRLGIEVSTDGGVTWSPPRFTGVGPWTMETSMTVGGPEDTWGAVLDGADVDTDSLAVRVSTQCPYDEPCTGRAWLLDWVSVRVRYPPTSNKAP